MTETMCFMKKGKGLTSKSSLKGKSSLSNNGGLKSNKKINSVSSKQKSINKELTNVYLEMEKTRPNKCTGCGCTEGLQRSHIIPRSYRRDLITDPNNITFHCIDCHMVWEHGNLEEMSELNDFEKNMTYIDEVDKTYYCLLLQKK